VWASVSIAVSMSPTSGFSVFGLFGRIMGSVLASESELIRGLLLSRLTSSCCNAPQLQRHLTPRKELKEDH
jgi:hypothetical protein